MFKVIFILIYLIRNLIIYQLLKIQIYNLKKVNLLSIIGVFILIPIPYYLLSIIFRADTYGGLLKSTYLILIDLILFILLVSYILYKKRKLGKR